MSLLKTIIDSAERIEIEVINKKVPEVIIKTDDLKCEVMKYIEDTYVVSSKVEQTDLLGKANNLSTHIEDLQKKVENVNKREICASAKEISSYASKLQESLIKLSIVTQVMEVHESLQKAKTLQNEKLYVEAIQELIRIQSKIQAVPEEEIEDALLELKVQVDEEIKSLLQRLNQICFQNIVFEENTSEIGHVYALKIKRKNDEFSQALNALTFSKNVIMPLEKFSKFLWENMFTPIINCKSFVKEFDEKNFICLNVEVVNVLEKDDYKHVFSKILNVTQFLHDHFEYNLQQNATTLSYIGNEIRENLSELLINNCLSDTIPSSTEGLQNYSEVIKDTEDLQTKLISYKIFKEDTTYLLDYTSNIDVLFINKKCENYLQYATSLMKKDLHDVVDVGQPHDINHPMKILGENEFPQSSVSSSVLKLLKLAEEIMQKATEETDVNTERLYNTVVNIFNEYGQRVYEYHQTLLQTIPQQVAIFYNNCMYISYQLTIWNTTFKNKLIGDQLPFKHQPIALRSLAENTFSAYVQTQIKQVEDILKDCGLCNIKSLDTVDLVTEKCIRQCLRQQELLKTVWQKVLPYQIYNKTLGTILNTVCDFLIKVIINIEDFSSSASETLVDILKVVLTRGPKLFTDSNEINLFVSSWTRLKELVVILNSGLFDIHERWADGKGPLALEFKPEEVKSLIRALFQNTDKRAAILSNIH